MYLTRGTDEPTRTGIPLVGIVRLLSRPHCGVRHRLRHRHALALARPCTGADDCRYLWRIRRDGWRGHWWHPGRSGLLPLPVRDARRPECRLPRGAILPTATGPAAHSLRRIGLIWGTGESETLPVRGQDWREVLPFPALTSKLTVPLEPPVRSPGTCCDPLVPSCWRPSFLPPRPPPPTT